MLNFVVAALGVSALWQGSQSTVAVSYCSDLRVADAGHSVVVETKDKKTSVRVFEVSFLGSSEVATLNCRPLARLRDEKAQSSLLRCTEASSADTGFEVNLLLDSSEKVEKAALFESSFVEAELLAEMECRT